jgi:hypothetical protein
VKPKWSIRLGPKWSIRLDSDWKAHRIFHLHDDDGEYHICYWFPPNECKHCNRKPPKHIAVAYKLIHMEHAKNWNPRR